MRLRVLTVVLSVLAVSAPAFAQHDLSLWHRSSPGSESALIPWYTYNGPVFVDARYAYDYTDTGALCLGKSFGSTAFTVVPEACGYLGGPKGIDGWGPELLLISSWGRVDLFVQNQYVEDVRSLRNGDASFFYQWTDVLVKTVPHVQLGVDYQVFVENRRGGYRRGDVGPIVRLSVKGWYAKAWVAWSVGPEDKGLRTTFLTVGKSW